MSGSPAPGRFTATNVEVCLNSISTVLCQECQFSGKLQRLIDRNTTFNDVSLFLHVQVQLQLAAGVDDRDMGAWRAPWEGALVLTLAYSP